MLIVDIQAHIWTSPRPAGPPDDPWPHRRLPAFTKDDLLLEMQAAGVHRAMIVPIPWENEDYALQTAAEDPARFAVLGRVALTRDPGEAQFEKLRHRPGMRGLRLALSTPPVQAMLKDGTIDWLWAAAERAGMPIGMNVPGVVSQVGGIAERHPGLKLTIGHLGTPRADTHTKDAAAFAHLPDLLALAKYPNVAVGASSLPFYSSQAYPFRNLDPYLHRVFDAFGPTRIFWGSDLTRLPCSYRQCVTHFTEELRFLSDSDKELIMGRALCRWLGWPE